jgi:hypothetical protein
LIFEFNDLCSVYQAIRDKGENDNFRDQSEWKIVQKRLKINESKIGGQDTSVIRNSSFGAV